MKIIRNIFLSGDAMIPAKKSRRFFIIAALFLLALAPVIQAQNQAKSGAVPLSEHKPDSREEDDLFDFFLEAVEGVEPSSAPVPELLLPASQPLSEVPPQSAPSGVSASDSGWTSLPAIQPPEDGSNPPAANLFAPADSFKQPASADFQEINVRPGNEPAAAPRVSVPLGQGAAFQAPAPFWDDYLREDGFPASEDGGNWIQLEVGQSDRALPTASDSPNGQRPLSIYSVPPPPIAREAVNFEQPQAIERSVVDKAMNQAIQEPGASKHILEPAERENLRKLFSDILPPESQARDPVEPLSQAASSTYGSGFMGGESAISQVGRLLSEPRLKIEPKRASSGGAVGPITAEVKIGNPAPAMVQATVPALNGLKPAPARAVTPAVQTAAKASAVKTAPEQPTVIPVITATAAKTSQPKAKKTSLKSVSQKKAAPVAGKDNFSLIVINETGQAEVEQSYSSVLKRFGYNVSSAVKGQTGKGPAGQTLVSYRPGYKAQAESVARSLPGKKILAEAKQGQVLSSEIMVYVR